MSEAARETAPGKDVESRLIDDISRLNAEAVDTTPGLARRAQHPKHHGCVRARFKVGHVPEDLRHGLFSKPGDYEAWVRFSNGRRLDDRKSDAHGMAIKVLGVSGEWISPEVTGESAQDFVLVDHETFFTGELTDYCDINRLLLGKGLARLALLPRLVLTRIGIFARILGFISHRQESPLESTYFSTTPFRLGDKTVKYGAKPRPSTIDLPPHDAEDRLAFVLKETLARGTSEFDFFADVQTDTAAQPVDDPSVAWSSVPGARRERLGTLEILRQDLDPGAPLGENIVFSPWHSLKAHEPLGAINRARLQSYEATARKRHEVNGVEPLLSPGVPDSYSASQPTAPSRRRPSGAAR